MIVYEKRIGNAIMRIDDCVCRNVTREEGKAIVRRLGARIQTAVVNDLIKQGRYDLLEGGTNG